MKHKRVLIVLLSVVLLGSTSWVCPAEDRVPLDTVVLLSEFTYVAGIEDSKEKAKALALFGAQFRAVGLSAKYLTHKGLLEPYGKKQNEIFCLTADEIDTEIVDERMDAENRTYYVKIRTQAGSADFIKAEIRNLELEKNEMKLSYAEEMGQYVMEAIDPGVELSRAYRHIRKGQWRLAIIYLDHLAKKYPHWAEVYHAKALGYYGQDDIDRMMEALTTACNLGSRESCSDLQSIQKPQPRPFKPQ